MEKVKDSIDDLLDSLENYIINVIDYSNGYTSHTVIKAVRDELKKSLLKTLREYNTND